MVSTAAFALSDRSIYIQGYIFLIYEPLECLLFLLWNHELTFVMLQCNEGYLESFLIACVKSFEFG